MRATLRIILAVSVLFLFVLGNDALSQVREIEQISIDTTRSKLPGSPERTLKFSLSLLNKDFQPSLNTVDIRKFNVQFPNNGKKEVTIKVYDIIGNLILVDRSIILSNYEKTFDMSKFDSNVFIVEINNGESTRTRSIYTGVKTR